MSMVLGIGSCCAAIVYLWCLHKRALARPARPHRAQRAGHARAGFDSFTAPRGRRRGNPSRTSSALPPFTRVNSSPPATPNHSLPVWAAVVQRDIGRLPVARFTDCYPDGACPPGVVEEWTA